MYSKGNFLNAQRPKMILLTVCLCLGSLVMCEVIDPLIVGDDSWNMSYQEGALQQSHLDEHDDDFVLMEDAIGRTKAISDNKNRSARIPGVSLSLSPLLPPPKAA
jgi:hypothetical protein